MKIKGTGRARWAAIGAAVAVTLGAGGVWKASFATAAPGGSVFVAIAPCRLFDTRFDGPAVGQRTSPLVGGESVFWSVRGANGNCNIPVEASAVVMNMTSVGSTTQGYLTVWPSDQAMPSASSLNWVAGQAPTPNAVTTKLSAFGQISTYINSGTVNLIADVTGYYADRNNDDRYYTKPQIDSQNYTKSQTDDRYFTKSQIGVRFIVDTGQITLLAGQYISGQIPCPAQTVPVGTGSETAGNLNLVIPFGTFVGYFLSNAYNLTVTVSAQAVCMQAPSGGYSASTMFNEPASQDALWPAALQNRQQLAAMAGLTAAAH